MPSLRVGAGDGRQCVLQSVTRAGAVVPLFADAALTRPVSSPTVETEA